MGGSAASLLAGLFADADPNETAVEREAKRNIITSLVTGIAAMSNPNGAATANNAAMANVDNNWLATQQYVQAKKEIDAEPSILKKLAIAGKWQITSLRQDLLTGSGALKGFTDGMAGAGLGTLDSAVTLLTDPVQSWEAVKEFASSKEARALLGDAVAAAFKSQVDQIGKAVVEGGDENAENLGKQMGQAVALVAQMMIGGGSSSAESALALSRMGIDVSVDTVKKIGASFDINVVKNDINKLQDLMPDSDVPVLDPTKPVTPPKTAGGAKDGIRLASVEVDVAKASKGTPEYKILNDPPPNSQVKLSNGTEFKTNSSGYVDEITYSPSLDKGGRDSRQTAVGKEGLPTDVGGHIQGCQFGGTCDRFNLFPQDGNFNNSAYKRWETEIKSGLNNGDQVGSVTVRFSRTDPTSARPDSLVIDYSINGTKMRKSFRNEAGQ